MDILPTNEYKEVEGRYYVNPQISLDESNTFIDNLRTSQGQQNQEIFTDTQRLGTDVPSDLGGLTGAGSYFTSRYQTPQTASNIANLRATAQASALNQVLANEEAMWKKRYNDAYRAYQKRTSGGGGDEDKGDVDEEETTTEIGSVTTEGIAKSMYDKKFLEYKNQGLSTIEAEALAKADMGIANVVNSEGTAAANGIARNKANIGGQNSYTYTLPNGRTVLVNEDVYDLIITSTGYVLRNRETGKAYQVGV